MIEETLSHYRILEKIGEGGMGVVYRAHDERLERDVALKVLAPGAVADEAVRRRFRKEALALSKLNHPHIAAVYDFDTHNGKDFLVMEFVPGQTLAEKLFSGPIPEREVLLLGAQIVDALAEAHEQGIVHRDLKPKNIIVTPKGQAKVLDFGLAVLVRPESDQSTTEPLSETGAVAGTVPYMAPEQLRGETVDARTDIYAVGALLYEMSTGQRPFPDSQGARLVAAILQEEPVAPSSINRRVSPALSSVIVKALDKQANRRYQAARELGVDLERLGAPRPLESPARSSSRKWLIPVVVALALGALYATWRFIGGNGRGHIESLAVLPLNNLSGAQDQEYFADGMTEELIASLAKISALRVRSRTSVMRYKKTDKPLPEIARELKVDAVVQGAVLQSGGRVRITAQLIEAATDRHLWSETYERPLGDVLALQSQVAQAIADEIKVKLTPQEKTRLAGARPVNPEAYKAYLKGRFSWNNRTPASLKQGITYFQESIAKDPGYALAYAGLADCYISLGFAFDAGTMAPKDASPKAREAADKALAMDDTLAEAHTSRGFIRFLYDWDWPAAKEEFERALALNPNYAHAHHWYSHYWTAMGQKEKSLAEAQRALQLEPTVSIISHHLGWHYFHARQYDLAIQQLQRTLELDPNFAFAHLYLGWTYQENAMYEKAMQELRRAVDLFKESPEAVAALGMTHARTGRKSEAYAALGELEALSRQRYVSPFLMAVVQVGLGDKNQAFAWLEKAFQDRSDLLVNLNVDPRLDPVRSDPRFQDLARRVGLPQ